MEQFTVFIICFGLATFLAGEVLFRRQRRDDPKRPLSSWLNRLSISDGTSQRGAASILSKGQERATKGGANQAVRLTTEQRGQKSLGWPPNPAVAGRRNEVSTRLHDAAVYA